MLIKWIKFICIPIDAYLWLKYGLHMSMNKYRYQEALYDTYLEWRDNN